MNILAVLIAAAAMFVIGFLWHGPLFGKTWMRLAGVIPTGQEKLSDMVPQMVWNYVANVVVAGVFAVMLGFIGSLVTDTPAFFDEYRGAIFAAWMWFGFSMPISAYNVIWMKESKKLWFFELSSQLASFLAMGAIIGAWR
jgi:hypothetical protein